MAKEGMVELPNMVRIRDWFDANKPDVKCKIHMQPLPDTSDVRITTELNSDEMMWILMMLFCIALRKGEV